MSSSKPGDEARTPPKPAKSDRHPDQPSAGESGGVPATEEDIGTEGAGTEPRNTADPGPGPKKSPQR